ncbi:MAG: HIT domain-containing protein [Magnetococcales bacterium]|nr:HIT domain-containing protein [Magnetococcales bacterium]
MNDSRYPWLILVPRRDGMRDLDELTTEEGGVLWGEITLASRLLREWCRPDKLNVAALGNMVPQLHLHVIARFRADAAWPNPVWGQHPPLPYDESQLPAVLAALKTRMVAMLTNRPASPLETLGGFDPSNPTPKPTPDNEETLQK